MDTLCRTFAACSMQKGCLLEACCLLGLLFEGDCRQGGWRIVYFADNFQIFCDFLGDFMKKIYFCGKV